MQSALVKLPKPRALLFALSAVISVSASLNPHREVWVFCIPFLVVVLSQVKQEAYRLSVFVTLSLCILAAILGSPRFSVLHPIARTHVQLTTPLGLYADGSVDVLPTDGDALRAGMTGRLEPGRYWASQVSPVAGSIEGYAVVLETRHGTARVLYGKFLQTQGRPVEPADLMHPAARYLMLPSQWPAVLTGKLKV